MVASENVFTGSKISNLETKGELITAMMAIIPSHLTNDDVVFLCIGTDRVTGDALAPLVGTYLTRLGYKNVNGTIDDPTHAENLQERLDSLPQDKVIIAIDATLGRLNTVGTFSVINGSIKPGAGVDKELPEAGDYSITGVVNVGGFMPYLVLQSTRLSVVMRMARDIASAISEVFPLEYKNHTYVNDDNNEKCMTQYILHIDENKHADTIYS